MALLALVGVFVLSIAAGAEEDAPQVSLAKSPEERVQRLFEAAKLGDQAKLGLYVADAKSGRVVLEINSGEPFIPASLLKLFTSAAALEILGPDTRFATEVETSGTLEDGELSGTLRLRGGGDPSFGPRFQHDRTATTQVFETFTEDLKRRGIRSIPGDIVVDDSLFGTPRMAMGWPRRERTEWYCAEVCALCYNDNTVDIAFKAGKKPGAKAEFKMSPQTEYVSFLNSVRVLEDAKFESGVRFHRSDTGREIAGRGALKPGESRTEYASVGDPAMFAGAVFAETLERKGIKFGGRVRRASAAKGELAPGWTSLTNQFSPPVSELLPVILAISQNLYAEVLLRHIAIATGKPGTFEGGAQALTEWVRAKGLPANGFNAVDGSGLSRLDRATPRQIGELLIHVAKGPHADLFRDALASPGEPGSLKSRFEPRERSELRGRLHAKTGFIDGVHGLAGYLTGERGGEYVFVVMANGVEADTDRGRRFTEELTLLLARSDLMP